MAVEITLQDLNGLIDYTFADVDVLLFAGGGAKFDFDYSDTNYLTGTAELDPPLGLPEGAFRLTYYSDTTGSVTADFYGDWPEPLTLSGLNGNDAWVASTANIKIEEVSVSVPFGYRILIDFNGEGPTVKDFVENWTEEDLIALNPLVNGEFATEGGWSGTSGGDRYLGTDQADVIEGLGGKDVLKGGRGNDEILGGSGHDKLFGQAGLDDLKGGAGNDSLFGGGGNDTLVGNGGNDRLLGGAGRDDLTGGIGRDLLSGGGGADILNAGAGKDRLIGGAGNDTLSGGAGNDTLIDGRGDDLIQGGGGADVFVFRNGVAGGDDLVKLQRFGGDVIRLQGYGVDVDPASASASDVETAMAAQGIHVVQQSTGGNFEVSFDGTGNSITLIFDQTVLPGQVWDYFEFA